MSERVSSRAMLVVASLLVCSGFARADDPAPVAPVAAAEPAPAPVPTPAVVPDPSAAAHFQSGLAYERLGRLNEAYTHLQLACVLDANDSRMALALGIIALRLGRDDVAQRALERSITLDANSAASYYQLAMLYEKQKASDRAVDSWNRFLELNPDEQLKLEARKHIHLLEATKASGAS